MASFPAGAPGGKLLTACPLLLLIVGTWNGRVLDTPQKERCGGWGFLGRPALQSDNSRRLHTPNVEGALPYRTKATFLARSDPGGRKGRQINILVSSAPRPSGTVRRGREGERENGRQMRRSKVCRAAATTSLRRLGTEL